MPYYVIERLALALDLRFGRPLRGAEILLVGVAYKRNVDDVRESPALKLTELLEARGARVAFHDPLISEIPSTREFAHLAGRQSIPLDAETLARSAATLIVTDHDAIDYGRIVAHAPLIVDTRNACGRAGFSSETILT